jgi:hypothetical protein
MLAASLITAGSLMRPWQEGQQRTSPAKVRAGNSAHRRHPPTGRNRSGSSSATGASGGLRAAEARAS